MILSSFTFTKRFVDDLLAVGNTMLPYLTYFDQWIGPIRGVYDSSLQLEPSVGTSERSCDKSQIAYRHGFLLPPLPAAPPWLAEWPRAAWAKRVRPRSGALRPG